MRQKDEKSFHNIEIHQEWIPARVRASGGQGLVAAITTLLSNRHNIRGVSPKDKQEVKVPESLGTVEKFRVEAVGAAAGSESLGRTYLSSSCFLLLTSFVKLMVLIPSRPLLPTMTVLVPGLSTMVSLRCPFDNLVWPEPLKKFSVYKHIYCMYQWSSKLDLFHPVGSQGFSLSLLPFSQTLSLYPSEKVHRQIPVQWATRYGENIT